MDAVLTEMREGQATLRPIDGRAAQNGDVAAVKFQGTIDGEPEATRGHKVDVAFPSGPRAVLPVKVKENLKVKGAWIVEALIVSAMIRAAW